MKKRLRGFEWIGLSVLMATASGCVTAGSAESRTHTEIGELLLDDSSFPLLRDVILPDDHERAFERYGWIPTLHDGLKQAAAQNKPVLLWVMNGHPLGCT